MDSIKGLLLYPVYIVASHTILLLSVLINLPFLICQCLLNGFHSVMSVRGLYKLLSGMPLGKVLMSSLISIYAPYSASIGAYIEEIQEDSCTIKMNDWPWLRNPFQSIHAVSCSDE